MDIQTLLANQNEIHNLDDLIEVITTLVDEFVETNTVLVDASVVGLDSRIPRMYVSKNEDFIATKNTRALDYYGGFEYVDSQDRTVVGGWTFYSGDSERVADAIDHWVKYRDTE
jgi:hypothetical protein